MPAADLLSSLPGVGERVRLALAVAESRSAGVPLRELADILPSEEPTTAADLAEWFDRHPTVGVVRENIAFGPDAPKDLAVSTERAARGRAYLASAQRFVERRLPAAEPDVLFLGVTGSTAFGDPREGDDVDFFAITRRGAVWPLVAMVQLGNRLRGRAAPAPGDPPKWCLNMVLDDRVATRSFARPQGLLFAREALTLRPLLGTPYYRRLLRASDWMRVEAPGMYARWEVPDEPAPEPNPAPRARWPVRVLNWMLFPFLAAYLHAGRVIWNGRCERSGRADDRFDLDLGPDRAIVRTVRFARLASLYDKYQSAGA